MEREQFTFYKSFYTSLRKLPAKDRIKVYDATCELALYGNDTQLEGTAGAVFDLVRPIINSGIKKAENRINKTGTNEKQSENKRETKPKEEKEEGKEKVKEQMLKENTKRKVFVKPTVEEIKAYIQERNSDVDPQRFFDHYESCGWKVGNKPMVDWKAAVRTWERNGYDKPVKKKVEYGAKAQTATASDIERMKAMIAEMKGETVNA